MSQAHATQRVSSQRETYDGTLAEFPSGTRRVEHLAELVPLVSQRFGLDGAMSAEEVLAALRQIAAYRDTRSRWLAAFTSPLGTAIAAGGTDLATSLGFIVSQLPRADA